MLSSRKRNAYGGSDPINTHDYPLLYASYLLVVGLSLERIFLSNRHIRKHSAA